MGDASLVIQAINACTGWLGGLVLLVVGLAFVRPVSGRAAMLLAGAGGVKILLNCCGHAPSAYYETIGFSETASSLFEVVVPLTILLQLAVYGFMVGGAVVLAREVLSGRPARSP